MAVYVDEAVFKRWGLRWCHLTADDTEELHAFAALLGVERSRFHAKPGRPWADHYDLTEHKRRQAVSRGAIEISISEAGDLLARKRRIARGESDG